MHKNDGFPSSRKIGDKWVMWLLLFIVVCSARRSLGEGGFVVALPAIASAEGGFVVVRADEPRLFKTVFSRKDAKTQRSDF
ncbi:MAG: hypothetical protein H6562_21475 [Lewinellaceae bacterium]|nr:hypothetical protein [Lewinellaceae bacterium]